MSDAAVRVLFVSVQLSERIRQFVLVQSRRQAVEAGTGG